MTSSRLTQIVDAWTLQAVEASRYLTRLYRVLGDGKQAAHAIQSGSPAEERARRLGLKTEAHSFPLISEAVGPEESQREATAWQTLIKAHAGVAAFHAMAEGSSSAKRSIQGSRSANAKAFHQSIQGYRTAFPERMANEGIAAAILSATDICAEALLSELVGSASPMERAALAQDFRESIHRSLFEAAGIPSSN